MFEKEEEYFDKVSSFEQNIGTIFKTVRLKVLEDKDYNIVISFLIEALDELKKKPSHSFLFTFMALDYISRFVSSSSRITDRLNVIGEKVLLKHQNNFKMLNEIIPLKSCKYMLKQLENNNNSIQNRVENIGIKDLREGITNKFLKHDDSYDKKAEIDRKKAYLYKRIISNDLKDTTYQIEFSKRFNLILSIYLFSLRNDLSHGSVISDTKSSTTKLNTFASDYWAFMYTYYIVIALIENIWNLSFDDYRKSIQINIEKYKELFGRSINN